MGKRRACILRHGATGDTLFATSIIPYLIADGYTVDFIVGKTGYPILEHDPRINLVRFPDNCLPFEDLDPFYQSQAKDYDKFVCLTGSVEDKWLAAFPSPMWYWPLGKLRKHCTENYLLDHIRMAGYEPVTEWQTGKLYFSPDDIAFSNNFRRKFKDRFILVWALAGSSMHKSYGYFDTVFKMLEKAIPELLLVTVGNENDMMLTFEHPKIINFGHFHKPIMTSFALAKIADLVVGPETAALNAAGCFDTPKICMLSHSSKKNLTATWKNDFSIQCASACSPCHKLQNISHIWQNVCELDHHFLHQYGAKIPVCAGMGFQPGYLFERIMEVYNLKIQRQS